MTIANTHTRRAAQAAEKLTPTTRRTSARRRVASNPPEALAPEAPLVEPMSVNVAALQTSDPAEAARPGGKLGVLADLMRRPKGALLQELMSATDWQAQTIRGAISATLKGKLKLTVASDKTEAGRRYRIVEGAVA